MPRWDEKTSKKKKESGVVVLGKTTRFSGTLKFNSTLCIQGFFKGTIDAAGDLIVDKDAVVDADYITVSSLTVYGSVIGTVQAMDKVDMMSGAKVQGDVSAARLRIADGVLFDGRCKMTNSDKDVEIFHRTVDEIKSDFQREYTRI